MNNLQMFSRFKKIKLVYDIGKDVESLEHEYKEKMRDFNTYGNSNAYSVEMEYYAAKIELCRDALELVGPKDLVEIIRLQTEIRIMRDKFHEIESMKAEMMNIETQV